MLRFARGLRSRFRVRITIKMDIFLLPMAGANMVIGIQGLKTLGPVTFDFEELLMKFEWEGKVITWKAPPRFLMIL